MVNGQRRRNVAGRVDLARGAHGPKGALDDAGQVAERYFAVKKGGDGDLVGGVERSRRPPPLGQSKLSDAQGRETVEVGGLEGQLRQSDEIGRRNAASDAL